MVDHFERQQLEQRAHQLDRQLTASAALMAAVEARDAYTADHSRAVVAMDLW